MEILKYRKDANSPWVSLYAIKGDPGKDYVLTESDKEEIAALVVDLIPNAEEVKY